MIAVRLSARRIDGIGSRVGDFGRTKCIPALAALAALATVQSRLWPHARQRQGQRDAEVDPQTNHAGLIQIRKRRLDGDRVSEPKGQARCAMAAKKSVVASGNGFPARGPSTIRCRSWWAQWMAVLASRATLRPVR